MFPRWDSCPKVRHSPNAIWYSFRGCCVILLYVKSNPILEKFRKQMFLRWDTGLKWDKTILNWACVSVVFTINPLVLHSPNITPAEHGSTGLPQARYLNQRATLLLRSGRRNDMLTTPSVKPYACESSREKRQQDGQTDRHTHTHTQTDRPKPLFSTFWGLYIPNPVLSRSRFFARCQYYHWHGSNNTLDFPYRLTRSSFHRQAVIVERGTRYFT